MKGKFELEIHLGNAAMSKPRQVAEALRKVASKIEDRDDLESNDGPIADANGNTVGSWLYDVGLIHIEDLERKHRHGEFTSNQRTFVEDALSSGHHVSLTADRRHPFVRVRDREDFETEAEVVVDSHDYGYIIRTRE